MIFCLLGGPAYPAPGGGYPGGAGGPAVCPPGPGGHYQVFILF